MSSKPLDHRTQKMVEASRRFAEDWQNTVSQNEWERIQRSDNRLQQQLRGSLPRTIIDLTKDDVDENQFKLQDRCWSGQQVLHFITTGEIPK
jgi:hypothetical protein